MSRLHIMTGFLVALACAFGAGCGSDETPTSLPGALLVPPTPSDLLVVALGESSVELTWEVSSVDDIAGYRVFRFDNANPDTIVVGEPVTASYIDLNLVPNRTYTYFVTSRGAGGLLSNPSGSLVVTPGIFTLRINAGASYTNSQIVNLSFSTPEDVISLRIGHSADLSGASYAPFAGDELWELEDSEGLRSVFAQFRTVSGAESPVISDDITLDRVARILSVTENSGGAVLTAGDSILVVLRTGESGGTASFTIDGIAANVPLPWSPSTLDYRTWFVVSPDLVVDEAVVRGNFTDRAGNVAAEARSTTSLTIIGNPSGDPTPVVLSGPTELGTNWVALEWSQNEDLDFSRYILYRGNVPSVEGDADDQVIAILNNASVTSFVDSLNLLDATTYYYRVFVEDAEGLTARSNEVSATTANLAPIGVESFAVTAVDSPSTSVRLTWSAVSPATVHDFAAYEVYRATSEAVSRTDELLAVIAGEIDTRSFLDETALQATIYYYRVYVVDEGGLATGSLIASATATDLDPSFLALSRPSVDQANQNVSLSWAQSPDPDFASYALYFFGSTSQTNPNPNNFGLVQIINNVQANSFTHYPQLTTTPYFVQYFMEVTDRAGRSTRSNIVQAVFGDAALPNIQNLAVSVGSNVAVITFTTDVPTTIDIKYSADQPLLDQTASDNQLAVSHSISITGLTEATNYFYQIEATNESGATGFSAVQAFTTTAIGP